MSRRFRVYYSLGPQLLLLLILLSAPFSASLSLEADTCPIGSGAGAAVSCDSQSANPNLNCRFSSSVAEIADERERQDRYEKDPKRAETKLNTDEAKATDTQGVSAMAAVPGLVEGLRPAPEAVAGTTAGQSQPAKEPEEDSIPERFIVGCNGDRVEAARRWKETCKWRKENDVDGIIDRPQPRFHQCREVFPVFVHGRSRKGLPVLWERIGKVNMARADQLKLPLADLTPNYVFLNECVWRVVLDEGEDDNDDAQFITVEDVGGVRLWDLTPRVLSVLRSLTGTMKAHYVERCYKSYIINAPRAFTALWRIVSPMLDLRTRAKVSILGSNYLEAMQEDMDISQMPSEYGGTSGRSIDDSDDERKIQALVARLNVAEK